MCHRPTPTARLWRGLGYGLLLAWHSRPARFCRALAPFAIWAFLNLRLAYLLFLR